MSEEAESEKLSPGKPELEIELQNKIKNKHWQLKNRVPYALLFISLLEIFLAQNFKYLEEGSVHAFSFQIVFYTVSNDKIQESLRFQPNKLHEVWRFVTYMLLHDGWVHLTLNIFMQLLFAYFLEIRHGHLRVLMVYLTGGITAVLGASCFHPDLVIGASGGVYALLISHVADIVMNFENMDHKIYRAVCILVIVFFDIGYNVLHYLSKDEPLISWGAHVTGGISGLFLGLIFFKREEWLAKTRKLILFWLGIIFYLILLSCLVVLSVQIKKCTPASIIRRRYIYFC